jgi:hypothetical protein
MAAIFLLVWRLTCAEQFFLTRTIAGLVFTTLLMTGAASASSFVTPQPMTAKLGPSMIALGEPAAAVNEPGSAGPIAGALDASPLDYPFPGGKAPIVRGPGIAVETPLNYPAPIGSAETDSARVEPRTPDNVDFVQISPSIIAMAAPEPVVSYEHVAAVDDGGGDGVPVQHNIFGPGPTVIRGGVVDNGGAPTEQAPTKAAQNADMTGKEPDDGAPPAPPPSNRPLPPNGLVGPDWRPSR